MNAIKNLTQTRHAINYGIPLLIVVFSIGLALSAYAEQYPELYTAITYDLILTAPLTLYLLFKRKLPKYIIGIFMSIGIISAYFVIPESQRLHFNIIRYLLLPAIELSALASIIYYTYKTIRGVNKTTDRAPDYLTVFQESGAKAFGHKFFGHLFGSELAMIHYAVFSWKPRILSQNEFSYHIKNGTSSMITGIIMVMIVETIGVHFLVALWSPVASWILTVLSLYTLMMLLAHLKAVKNRPHTFYSDTLELKIGLLGTTRVPFHNISRIEFSKKIDAHLKENACQYTPLGDMESFNTVIYLKEEIECEFIYGIKRKCSILLVAVDELVQFKDQIPIDHVVTPN